MSNDPRYGKLVKEALLLQRQLLAAPGSDLHVSTLLDGLLRNDLAAIGSLNLSETRATTVIGISPSSQPAPDLVLPNKLIA